MIVEIRPPAQSKPFQAGPWDQAKSKYHPTMTTLRHERGQESPVRIRWGLWRVIGAGWWVSMNAQPGPATRVAHN